MSACRTGAALVRPLSLLLLGLAAPQLAAQGPPQFRPWIYGNPEGVNPGNPVWQRHRFLEDNGLTERVLSRELVNLPGQSPARPEMILFNRAQYSPPEGVPAGPGERQLNIGSIQDRGVQFYVNYSQVSFGSGSYDEGTFFVPTELNDEQVTPPIPAIFPPFSELTISATGGAFGFWDPDPEVTPKSYVPPYFQAQALAEGLNVWTGAVNALYVTAGVIYSTSQSSPTGVSEFLPSDDALAIEAGMDRLFVIENGVWVDRSDLVPVAARRGHSSAVVFAELSGDHYMDLYIGKSGDRFRGARNFLLFGGPTGFTNVSATKLPLPFVGQVTSRDATTDVAVADLDRDSDLDLVVANRMPMDSSEPAWVSTDYALMNNGSGNFSGGMVILDANATDTRSVAVGNLDEAVPLPGQLPATRPEIVFGNAGSDGYELDISPTHDHPMAIYAYVGSSYVNKVSEYLTVNQERIMTAPLTRQVMLVDLLSNPSPEHAFAPDGYLDLVIVNHRDHLKTGDVTKPAGQIASSPAAPGSIVRILANRLGYTLPKGFDNTNAWVSDPWIRTAVLSNYLREGESPASPTLDLFVATGNRFHGEISYQYDNLGVMDVNGVPWDKDYHDAQTYNLKPGAEHGYGLDFADYNDDGRLDAMALARSYNFLVYGIGGLLHADWHFDFAPTLSNRRGRLMPQGMEDGVFADFDRDGDLDAVLASQVTGSEGAESPDTIVLHNFDGASFEHAKEDAGIAGDTLAQVDQRVDIRNRKSKHRARIADRAVAGDMDNDGDVDAIVRLFQVNSLGKQYCALLTNPYFQNPPTPIEQFSAGWRYLVNVIGEGDPLSPIWFEDWAPERMRDTSGNFSPTWNRRLGMDLLLDADNNGCLDLVSTVGPVVEVKPPAAPLGESQVETSQQARDLLFLNGVDGTPPGVLTEVSGEFVAMTPGGLGIPVLPPSPGDVIDIPGTTNPNDMPGLAGSFFVAAGDIDNDGDADLFITHNKGGGGQTTAYPSLMINQFNPSLGLAWGTCFADKWAERVNPLDHTKIFCPPVVSDMGTPATGDDVTYTDMDASWSGGFLDFDADGDNDLVYIVTNDLPRFLQNTGHDSNADGDYADSGDFAPGNFEDVTAQVLTDGSAYKVTTDGNDFQVVDLDNDGDLDFAVYPFSDKATLWVNPLVDAEDPVPGLPVVTEIWPRVGSRQGTVVTMHGANLEAVNGVELSFAGGQKVVLSGSAVVPLAGNKLQVTLPSASPLGLARVRVCNNVASPQWSTQYQGYYVLDL